MNNLIFEYKHVDPEWDDREFWCEFHDLGDKVQINVSDPDSQSVIHVPNYYVEDLLTALAHYVLRKKNERLDDLQGTSETPK